MAHFGKTARANLRTKALPKSEILPTHAEQLDNYMLFFEKNLYFS
jgi:hypothetical protein